MKRCSYCGGEKDETYQYCLRCGITELETVEATEWCPKRFEFVRAAAFLAGIPAWVVAAYFLDMLNRALSGMTGAGGTSGNIPSVMRSWSSHLIIGYFLASTTAVLATENKELLKRTCLIMHACFFLFQLFLSLSSSDASEWLARAMALLFIVSLVISPWIFAWTILLATPYRVPKRQDNSPT